MHINFADNDYNCCLNDYLFFLLDLVIVFLTLSSRYALAWPSLAALRSEVNHGMEMGGASLVTM